MKKEYEIGLLAVALFVGFYFGFLAVKVGPVELGSALDGGAKAEVATSSDLTLAKAVVTNLVGTTTCTSRKITTGVSGISLQFGDEQGDRLTNFVGHWQAASTTVDYDGALTGCGLVRARSDNAGVIRITDYR